MAQGSFNPKNRFLGQKVCSVAHVQTHRQTDTKVNTEDTLSGFHNFSLHFIIKDRSKNIVVGASWRKGSESRTSIFRGWEHRVLAGSIGLHQEVIAEVVMAAHTPANRLLLHPAEV